MNGIWLQLGLVAFLVFVNAVFAGSEIALISLREGQLRRLERRSAAGAAVARLAREPNRFLATINIGLTMAAMLASASAAVSLAAPLEERLDVLGRAARPVSVVLVTMLLAYVMLVFGELAPKRVGMQRAERWGLLCARPIAAMARLARPAVWVLSRSTNVAVRLMGGDPHADREEVTPEELRDMVATQKSFTAQQRRIIDGAFEIAERSLADVLRPRPDVFTIDVTLSCDEARAALVAAGHSRAPVVAGGSLDDVVGIVLLRDLVDPPEPCAAGDLATAATIFPETLGALDALRQLQRAHVQMAVVINEHGGAEGIVTVEDLVEELVGEIYDETDRDVLTVRRQADGSMVLPGRFPVHDLPDLGVEVPEGQYATVAGYLLWRLQRIPDAPGDAVEVDGWRLTVTRIEERAITGVHLTRIGRKPVDGVEGEDAVIPAASGEEGRGIHPADGGEQGRKESLPDHTASR
jgi:putative hemolysin